MLLSPKEQLIDTVESLKSPLEYGLMDFFEPLSTITNS